MFTQMGTSGNLPFYFFNTTLLYYTLLYYTLLYYTIQIYPPYPYPPLTPMRPRNAPLLPFVFFISLSFSLLFARFHGVVGYHITFT